MLGPCLVVLGLSVFLTNCKAIEEVPLMGRRCQGLGPSVPACLGKPASSCQF